mgnify:FL=1
MRYILASMFVLMLTKWKIFLNSIRHYDLSQFKLSQFCLSCIMGQIENFLTDRVWKLSSLFFSFFPINPTYSKSSNWSIFEWNWHEHLYLHFGICEAIWPEGIHFPLWYFHCVELDRTTSIITLYLVFGLRPFSVYCNVGNIRLYR